MTAWDLRHLSKGTTVYVKAPIANCAGTFEELVVCAPDESHDGKWVRGEVILGRVTVYGEPRLFTASQIEAAAAA